MYVVNRGPPLKEVVAIFKLISLSKAVQSAVGPIAASLLAGGTLWYVAMHTGPKTGTAVIHVTEDNVVVKVGEASFQVEGWQTAPIVCELPAGEHRLVMTRGSTELYSETFWLDEGGDIVLTAWRSGTGASAGAGSGSRSNPPMR
jgi:hypothetical protein